MVKVKVKSLSRVPLFATPWTVAYQAPPSMGFSRQEYWSGVPFLTLNCSVWFLAYTVTRFTRYGVFLSYSMLSINKACAVSAAAIFLQERRAYVNALV